MCSVTRHSEQCSSRRARWRARRRTSANLLPASHRTCRQAKCCPRSTHHAKQKRRSTPPHDGQQTEEKTTDGRSAAAAAGCAGRCGAARARCCSAGRRSRRSLVERTGCWVYSASARMNINTAGRRSSSTRELRAHRSRAPQRRNNNNAARRRAQPRTTSSEIESAAALVAPPRRRTESLQQQRQQLAADAERAAHSLAAPRRGVGPAALPAAGAFSHGAAHLQQLQTPSSTPACCAASRVGQATHAKSPSTARLRRLLPHQVAIAPMPLPNGMCFLKSCPGFTLITVLPRNCATSSGERIASRACAERNRVRRSSQQQMK